MLRQTSNFHPAEHVISPSKTMNIKLAHDVIKIKGGRVVGKAGCARKFISHSRSVIRACFVCLWFHVLISQAQSNPFWLDIWFACIKSAERLRNVRWYIKIAPWIYSGSDWKRNLYKNGSSIVIVIFILHIYNEVKIRLLRISEEFRSEEWQLKFFLYKNYFSDTFNLS